MAQFDLSIFEEHMNHIHGDMGSVDGICCSIVHPIVEEAFELTADADMHSGVLNGDLQAQVTVCLASEMMKRMLGNLAGGVPESVADDISVEVTEDGVIEHVVMRPEMLEQLLEEAIDLTRLADRLAISRLGNDETAMPFAFVQIVIYAAQLVKAFEKADHVATAEALAGISVLAGKYNNLLTKVGIDTGNVNQDGDGKYNF